MKVLVNAIYDFVFGLSIDLHYEVEQILKHFVFETMDVKKSFASYEDDDDDDDDCENSNSENNNNNNNNIRITSVSFMKGLASALLSIFKLSAVVAYDAISMKHREARENVENSRTNDESTFTATNLSQSPLNIMVDDCHNRWRNPQTLALLIHNLGEVEKASASDLNACVLRTGTDGLLAIDVGIDAIDAGRFISGSNELRSAIQTSLFECFGRIYTPQHQSLWDIIMDPQSVELGLIPIDQNNLDCASMNMNTASASELRRMISLENVPSHSPVTKFKMLLFTAIHFYAGSVMRAPELCHLELTTPKKQGSLILTTTSHNVYTLSFWGLVSKTYRESLAMLPFWLSRLIMIYFQFLAPLFVEPLCTQVIRLYLGDHDSSSNFDELLDSLGDEAERTFFTKVKAQTLETLTTCLGYNPDYSPTFLGEIRSRNPFRKTINSECLFFITPDEMTRSISRHFSNMILQCDVTFARLRHVLLQLKTYSDRFLTERLNMVHKDDKERRDLINIMLEGKKSIVSQYESLVATTGIGQHSTQTNHSRYQAQFKCGRNITVPMLEMEATKLNEAMMSVLLGLPISPSPSHLRSMVSAGNTPMWCLGKRMSVLERRMTLFPELQNGNMTPAVDDMLKSSLTSVFKKEDYTCAEQAEAVLNIFTSRETVALWLPCGSGKTLAFLLPLNLAPEGFTMVILPYVALMHSAFRQATEEFGLRCEIFRPGEERFTTTAFHAARPRSDPVRFVFVVTDTAVSDACRGFLAAAKHNGLLVSVVLDEVHQTLTSQSYRNSMKQVKDISGIGVPVVLASGTVPKELEESLFLELRLLPQYVRIVRKPNSYKNRLIANLVHFPPSSVKTTKQLVDLVCDVLLKERALSGPGNMGSVLVFSPTRFLNQTIADMWMLHMDTFENTNIVRVDAESTEEQRKEFFGAFHQPKPNKRIYAFTTIMCSEGIDFPNISWVVVVGGCWGGALELHQMFNRAGRGVLPTNSSVSQLPTSLFLYTPGYLLHEIFRTQASMDLHDSAVLSPFLHKERKKAETLCTMRGLVHLFDPRRDGQMRCGGAVMEELLGSSKHSSQCGECFGCNRDSWLTSILPPDFSSGRVAVQQPSASNEWASETSADVGNDVSTEVSLERFITCSGTTG